MGHRQRPARRTRRTRAHDPVRCHATAAQRAGRRHLTIGRVHRYRGGRACRADTGRLHPGRDQRGELDAGRLGPERSVAATKTYTTQLAVLCLLSALLSGDTALLGALEAVPEAMARVLEGAASIAEQAERYRSMGACAVLGRGLNYCTALETALKMKETSYVVAD